MIVLVILLLGKGVNAGSIYSGRCVYPGGIFKINLSGGFTDTKNYTAVIKNEHATLEFYDNGGENAEILMLGNGGRFPLYKLNYVKAKAISGPYLTLSFDIYDGAGSLVSFIDSGKICNLAWFREKHGKFERYYLEKDPPATNEAIIPPDYKEKEKNMKAAVFCFVSFTLGGLMGFRTAKMIEY
ncbi:hypothetical protein A2380_03465 [candidate division WWE3 bacterium RIFOXYB1_FULL_43_24]|uniref:Uncharacterized protein n=2 Tax=Katanobacteria TaxID=422282 RepID=A0A0G1BMZ8_UNCKA|nr:MAG: hypothetical protein UU92_C0006G0007 [candidate division WWE3 bacterium GW2011_GWA1_42_12]KKS33577.1 MAG: hypothetical protein UU97_C0026G0007 [candidate division WWE3 bacterium GW2011_GWD1_42_14]KKS38868.1 MAG: hypothetical protein UV00_C0005G0051 [candidate division WWE3 bacterium GW2011_GWF1_42_14]KKS40566.1 MAG: hypothetical protein UV03_C0005G0052 [candidate division WWE3 bacterium GW2011_GWE1_42_16]KKS66926.1 MAG: hypothetical protein UV35_C0005G0007 [candidate division WWE3 bacte